MDNETALQEVNRSPFLRTLKSVKHMILPVFMIMLIYTLGLLCYTRGVLIIELREELNHSRNLQRLMVTNTHITMDNLIEDVKQLEWTDGNRSMRLINTGLIKDGAK